MNFYTYEEEAKIKDLISYMKEENLDTSVFFEKFHSVSVDTYYRKKTLMEHFINSAHINKLTFLFQQKSLTKSCYFHEYGIDNLLKKVSKNEKQTKAKKRFIQIFDNLPFLSSSYESHNLYRLLFLTIELQGNNTNEFHSYIINSLDKKNVNITNFNDFSIESRISQLDLYIKHTSFDFWNNLIKRGLKPETEFLLTYYRDKDYPKTLLLFQNKKCDLDKIIKINKTRKYKYSFEAVEIEQEFNLLGFLKNHENLSVLPDIEDIIKGKAYYKEPFNLFTNQNSFTDDEIYFIAINLLHWEDTLTKDPNFSLDKNPLFHEYVNAFNFLKENSILYSYNYHYHEIRNSILNILDKNHSVDLNIYLTENKYKEFNTLISDTILNNDQELFNLIIKNQIDVNQYHDGIHPIFNKPVIKKLLSFDQTEIQEIFTQLKEKGLHFKLSFNNYHSRRQLQFFNQRVFSVLKTVFPEQIQNLCSLHILSKLNADNFTESALIMESNIKFLMTEKIDYNVILASLENSSDILKMLFNNDVNPELLEILQLKNTEISRHLLQQEILSPKKYQSTYRL